MSAPYSTADGLHDAEALRGPRCPLHGRDGCLCCHTCGRAHSHAEWCREHDESDTED